MKAVFKNGIVKIKSYPKVLSRRYDIREVSVHVKWFTFKKETIVKGIFDESYSIDEFTDIYAKEYYIESGEVYYRPHCDLYLADGSNCSKFFYTVEELNQFVETLLAENPHIII